MTPTPVARFRAWLERVPIEDELERRHAAVLQIFALVFFCGVLVIEFLRWGSGGQLRSPAASLVNVIDVGISGLAVWWIRRGRYRWAARLFVFGYSGVLAAAVSIGGLEFSRDGMRALAVALALAALLLGRRALWTVFVSFLASLSVALARDQGMLGGTGPHPSAASRITVFWASAFGFCVLAIVLDRFGLTVLEAFSAAVLQKRELEATTGNLRAANEALAAEVKERQRVEEQLRDSEQLFRVAFQTSPYAISINRISDGVFLAVNQGFIELSGFSEAEAIGRPLRELWVDDPVRVDTVARIRRDGAVREVEVRFRSKDGRELLGRFSAQRFDVGGFPHVLSVTRDVTAAKAAEEEFHRLQAQLVQAQRMEAVGTLAAGIAHDFNNILGIVTSYAALARQGLPAGSPVHEDLGQIDDASRRAAGLVRQLLSFSSRQAVQPEAVDVAALVVEAQRLLRRVLPSDIGLRTALAPGLPRVLIDRSQLEQVLMNLSVNARDAMPQGGLIEISAFRQNGEVAVTVRDTGTGIPRELQSKIFDPFFTTKEPGKGTGLGLATCYGIVRQAGGRIEVESEPGAGTLFRVLLPALANGHAALAAPAPGRVEDPQTAQRGSETVLLAEDEPQIREATARMLRSLGYRVLVASDAAAALSLSLEAGAAIDLLVTDLIMPGMRGPDLARALRSRLPRVRTLFISGYADAALLGSAREEGAALLGKPFTLETLAASVRKALDGQAELERQRS